VDKGYDDVMKLLYEKQKSDLLSSVSRYIDFVREIQILKNKYKKQKRDMYVFIVLFSLFLLVFRDAELYLLAIFAVALIIINNDLSECAINISVLESSKQNAFMVAMSSGSNSSLGEVIYNTSRDIDYYQSGSENRDKLINLGCFILTLK
jgi:hypothetical protein